MVKVHRLGDASASGPSTPTALLLDTPFGFQTNADDIAARAVCILPRKRRRHLGGGRVAVGRRPCKVAKGDAIVSRLATAPLRVLRPGQPYLRAAPVARHA